MWKKHGLIFEPGKRDVPWLCSHAWVPTIDTSGPGNPRVYFAGRNADNFSQVGVFTLDPGAQCPVSEFGGQPVLTLGELGHFDDSAVVLSGLSPCAFAYIDPGVTYALLQALFVFVFGAATAFILRPWTWIKSWFKKDTGPVESDTNVSNKESEHDSSSS